MASFGKVDFRVPLIERPTCFKHLGSRTPMTILIKRGAYASGGSIVS